MTLFAILAALIGGALWSAASGTTEIAGPVTVFVAAFIAGLASASLAALISRDGPAIRGAAVLILNFAVSHFAWTTSDPVMAAAILDVATGLFFALAGRTRWEFVIGALYLGSATVGVLTGWLGIIPDASERPAGFLAFSHPDLLALIGHAANVTLGMGAGDWGRRVRSGARKPSPLSGAVLTP